VSSTFQRGIGRRLRDLFLSAIPHPPLSSSMNAVKRIFKPYAIFSLVRDRKTFISKVISNIAKNLEGSTLKNEPEGLGVVI